MCGELLISPESAIRHTQADSTIFRLLVRLWNIDRLVLAWLYRLCPSLMDASIIVQPLGLQQRDPVAEKFEAMASAAAVGFQQPH